MLSVAGEFAFWDISEVPFPERCVIWEVVFLLGLNATGQPAFRLAQGDQLPTTTAQMDALEPLLMGFGFQGAEPRTFGFDRDAAYMRIPLRMPLSAGGRRLVLEVDGVTGSIAQVFVGVIVSSLPMEVPDCLLSANLKSQ